MAYRYNPASGQLEDENGNPVGAAPLDQMQPAPGPAAPALAGTLAESNRMGRPTNEPVVLDRSVPGDTSALPPMPSPAAAPAATPALPSKVVTGGTTTTTRTIESPEAKAAQAKVMGDVEQQAKAVEEEAELKGKIAGVQAEGAEKKKRINEDAAIDQKAAVGAHEEVIAAARKRVDEDRAKYDAEVDRLSKMDVRDYYEGQPGKRIANAVFAGLGELGATLARTGHNTALEVIQHAENTWYQRERQRIENQKDVVGAQRERVGMSQAIVEEKRRDKADQLADLDRDRAAKLNALADAVEAKAAEYGTDFAKAEGKRMAGAIRAEGNKALLSYAQHLQRQVHASTTFQNTTGGAGGAGGAGAEARAKAEADAQNAKNLQRLAQLATKNPAALKKVQDAYLTERRAQALGKTGDWLKATGLMAASVDQRLGDDNTAREINSLMSTLRQGGARDLDPVGALNEGALQAGDTHTGWLSATPDAFAQTAMRYSDQFQRKAAATLGASAPVAAAPATAPAQPTKEDQERVRWARFHPKDPLAKKILEQYGLSQ